MVYKLILMKSILYSLVGLIFLAGCKPDENTKVENVYHHNNFTVNQKPKNIILFIGDGMGLAQVYAAMIVNKGFLNVLEFPVLGLSNTSSANNLITESAAGATAIACGEKTNNGYIGVSVDGNNLKSILEFAEQNSLSSVSLN